MTDPVNPGAGPGANGGTGGTGGTPDGAPNNAPARPDYLPEQFWNKEKGEANLEGLAKEYTALAGKVPKVPDKYDLKLPEGALLPASAVERTAAIARKLGLSQEHANELLAHEAGSVKAYFDGLTKDHTTRSEKWLADARADRDIGGEKGEQFEANATKVMQTFKHFFGDDVAKLMEQTGFGNHPGVIKGFLKIAKEMEEDAPRPPGGGGNGTAPKDAASVLYGNNQT